MKVTGPGPTQAAQGPRRSERAKGKSDTSFARELSEVLDGPGGAGAAESPQAVGGVESLLAAQEVQDSLDPEARRRQRQRLVQRGEELLDRLEELRHGLLFGALPKDRLVALAQLVRSRRETVDDPLLAQILDEIELRAAVELAKLSG